MAALAAGPVDLGLAVATVAAAAAADHDETAVLVGEQQGLLSMSVPA